MNEERDKAVWPVEPPRVIAVRPLDGYRLELKFNDGTSGVVSLDGWLIGAGGMFAALEDTAFFQQVRLSTEAGTIEWPNGVDLCPDVLYSRMTGIPIPFAEREAAAPVKT